MMVGRLVVCAIPRADVDDCRICFKKKIIIGNMIRSSVSFRGF